MLSAFRNAFKVPDLRGKILFTLGIIAVYRLGSHLPVPGVDFKAVHAFLNSAGAQNNSAFTLINLFSGGALTQFAVFALGIMPYITSSIIMQLLGVVIPRLEQLQKEGESGRKRIQQITRYVTVGLAILQSAGIVTLAHNQQLLPGVDIFPGLDYQRFALAVLTLSAGTALIMWLGELITQRGIGNGMSIIIFSAIVARLPSEGASILRVNKAFIFGLVMALGLLIIVAVIFVEQAQRRIPVQYAKRNHPAYIIAYFVLIILFAYFYNSIAFNPVDTADNMKKYGGFIPGIRPGRPTAEYLDHILTRITLPGAMFLAAVAILPFIALSAGNIQQFPFGGTAILITVGVGLETMKQIESQLLMRNYEGFLR